MKGVLILAMTASLGAIGARLVLPSNSQAATQAGLRHYLAGDYRGASDYLGEAVETRPSSLTEFNAGSARVAAGDRRGGAAMLENVARTGAPDLAAAALYNLGTDALKQSKNDLAVESLIGSLRKNPADRNAKRNLEIALRKQEEEQQEGGGGGGNQDQQQEAPPSSDQPGPNDGSDAALRAIEQQEREELGRMRRSGKRSQRIGW